jgi:hypothetical protein
MCSSVAVISGKLYINKSGVKIPTDAMVSENANPAINIETGHMCFLFRKIQISIAFTKAI